MSCREVGAARRAATRGRAADDIQGARLALALAHERRRRRPSGWDFLVLVAIVLLLAWLIAESARSGPDAGTWVLGGLLALILKNGLASWRHARTAPGAERENLRVLESSGGPVDLSEDVTAAKATPTVRAVRAAVSLVFYDLSFGAGTLAIEGRAATLARVILHGALYAVAMTVLNLTVLQEKTERVEAPE